MTNLSAADRSQIYTELAEATSPMTAEAIMHRTVDVSWQQLVTKDHLDTALAQATDRLEARLEARFDARLDARLGQATANLVTTEQLDAKLDARLTSATANLVTTDQLKATIEGALRRQTIWYISTLFACNGLLVAWFSAFH